MARNRRLSMEDSESQKNNTLERSTLLEELAAKIVSRQTWTALPDDEVVKHGYLVAWKKHLRHEGRCTFATAHKHILRAIELIEKKAQKGRGDAKQTEPTE